MLRIALVDDEPEFLNLMKGLLQEWVGRKGELCCIDTFRQADIFYMKYMEGRSYDVCFLDISMPQMDGRELAKKIREHDEEVNLVFLTSHSEFIKAGYQIRAFDFVDKEDAGDELPELMDKILCKKEKDAQESYKIRNLCRYEVLRYSEIIYIYKRDQNVIFVTRDGERQERNSLKNVLENLDKGQFILVERGYIVNLTHIVRVNAREIRMSDGTVIVASKEHIQSVRDHLGMYCMHSIFAVKE